MDDKYWLAKLKKPESPKGRKNLKLEQVTVKADTWFNAREEAVRRCTELLGRPISREDLTVLPSE